MKKDKKFLLELEQQLSSINKKKRDVIVLKYRKIIDEKINEKKVVELFESGKITENEKKYILGA
jgi:hypothetical protein